MKLVRLFLSITILLGTVAFAQNEGWNIVNSGTTTPPTISSPAVIDVLPFFSTTTADICAAINTALNLVTPAGSAVVLDARGISTATGLTSFNCAMNPFTNNSSKGYTGKLLLGSGTIVTSAQWNMPNSYFWIEGTAISNGSSLGTVIQASGGGAVPQFKCTTSNPPDAFLINNGVITNGCPVVFISGRGCSGSPSCVGYDSMGTGIRNLTIDCNSSVLASTTANCLGVGSRDVQEGGGVDTVQFISQYIACVAFDTANASPSSAGVSNPFIRNANCVFDHNTVQSGAVGIYINASDGPAEISNTSVTAPMTSSTSPTFRACLYFDGGRGTNINYFHCEHGTTAEQIGGAFSVSGINVHGLTVSASNLGVFLSGATDTSVEDVEVAPLPPSTYVAPLKDGTTIVGGGPSGGPPNLNLASYVTSTTVPPSASKNPVTNIVTTDAGTPSAFYRLTLNAVTANDLASLPVAPQGTEM